eukprot:TRINITY_DN12395_c0_g1_i1.p1 TRINITY_DN12395_c0_g1~~TRINITY_DN12395_c0_g1_i1.p1  ORF type:complete len:244 (+),score=73.13 TRINITY_DN12395_c0_g1_i1:138-869(+)
MAQVNIMFCLLCLLPFLIIVRAKSMTRQMTIEIEARDDWCFFVPSVYADQTMDFEFQVTDSSHQTGKNDITVRIASPKPDSELIYHVIQENEGSFSEEMQKDGDYEICLDNKMSAFSDKVVWFEVTVHDPKDDYYDDYIDSDEMNAMVGRNEDYETIFDMKVEDIKESVHTTRINLGKMKHFQFMQSADMSRDTHHVSSNMETINFWSLVHLAMMLLVGFTQVFMVKQLFADKSFLYKMSNKI